MADLNGPWIIVPNYNGRKWLRDCFDSLYESLPESTTVLMVDNGSTDGSADWVRGRFPTVRLLRLDRNFGFVRSVNLAALFALRSGASDVVLVNNDVRFVDPHWYRLLGETLERRTDVGVAGPWQNDYAGRPSRRTVSIVAAATGEIASEEVRRRLPETVDATWIEGSCIWIRREVFERIGYFDELFAPAYWEEVDFCRRARLHGVGVAMSTESVIEHFGAGSGETKQLGGSPRRIILERNYLVYHLTDPRLTRFGAWLRLCERSLRHGLRKIVKRELTIAEWFSAVGRTIACWGDMMRKRKRDRRGEAVSPTSSLRRNDDERIAYRAWVERIVERTSDGVEFDDYEFETPGYGKVKR
jgi:GT2 family glycosyltransferase